MKDKSHFGWSLPCALGLMLGCTGNIDAPFGSFENDFGQPPSGERGGTNEKIGSSSPGTTPGGAGAGAGTGAGTGADPAGGSGGGTTTPSNSVSIRLLKIHGESVPISFGVPVPKGALQSAATVQVLAADVPQQASVRELLAHYASDGKKTGVAAIQIQLPASAMTTTELVVEVRWAGAAATSATNPTSTPTLSFENVSVAATATAKTTVRSIASASGKYVLTESAPTLKTLFTGREPNVLASFPEGYLAATGVMGMQVAQVELAKAPFASTKFLSDQFNGFTLSSTYPDNYAYNADAESVVDLETDYSAWLYDRCATYLTAFVHFADQRFLRYGLNSCAYFSSKIGLSGATRGIFTAKAAADSKYSHARGLYAYYALTGDENALAAGTAIADMWLADTSFVAPYRAGQLRGADKLWTERLLAASLEGLLYGFRLTGDTKYLIAAKELVDTAYLHITGAAADLAAINPGANFPPQNCFIHSGLQQAESTAGDPWCSPWMSELVVDPLLQYQALTNDVRVDEIFVRLGRFLRDVGTAYFTKDPLDDSFMAPSVCDDPSVTENRRRLVPLYGAGLNSSGQRVNAGEWSDFEHCADATALSAAALRALKRMGQYDKNPIGPFKSEGESFMQLHHELLSCAERTFQEQIRPKRDPANWTSTELAAGAADPGAFITANKIGFPTRVQSPQRKLSWWFNTSMQEFKMLEEVGLDVGALRPGAVQPSGCK